MSIKRLSAISVFLLGAAVASPSMAADHQDSPAGSTDPTADITDFLAFKSAETGKLVLVMNVHSGAFKDAKFSDKVTYSFRVRPDAKAAKPASAKDAKDAKDAPKAATRELRVDCTFDDAATQHVSCTAYKFDVKTRKLLARPATASGPVNEPVEKEGLRIFAGMRADPFYIDAAGAAKSVPAGKWQFTGDNALKGADVLSIVVELADAESFVASSGNGPSKIVRAAVETSMRVMP